MHRSTLKSQAWMIVMGRVAPASAATTWEVLTITWRERPIFLLRSLSSWILKRANNMYCRGRHGCKPSFVGHTAYKQTHEFLIQLRDRQVLQLQLQSSCLAISKACLPDFHMRLGGALSLESYIHHFSFLMIFSLNDTSFVEKPCGKYGNTGLLTTS